MIDFTGVMGMINYNYEIRGDDRSHYVAYVDDKRPFLWKPTVVEAILRNKLNLIVEARCQQLKGKNVDIQNIFYGRNPHYRSSTWNREQQLGAAIVSGMGLECGAQDAAYCAAFSMLYEFLKTYLAYENEEIGDEYDDNYVKEVDQIIAFYVSLYLGKNISKQIH
jgi:hypothetical protein